MLSISIILSPAALKAQKLHSGVIEHIDALLYGWLGSDSQGSTDTKDFKKVLAKISNNKKEHVSYLLGEMYIALFEYNLEQYESVMSSLVIDSLYLDRARVLHALITANVSFSISGYLDKSSSFNDIDYLLTGNYYLQRGNYAKAGQWFIQGLQNSIGLRKSFDILLGVVDTAKKGESYIFIQQNKGKTIPFICLLPYLRPQDIYYFFTTEFLPADYTLATVPSDKFNAETVQSNLSEKKFTLSYTHNSPYCTMLDIINCFTSIMQISGKTPSTTNDNVSYLPKNVQATASFLIEQSILQLYLDGKIPTHSPISGIYFKKLYSTYITKNGKPAITVHSSSLKPFFTNYSIYSYTFMTQYTYHYYFVPYDNVNTSNIIYQ